MRLFRKIYELAEDKLRILVVEDEMMVAMMIEDMISDLGHIVVGPAMRLEPALALASNEAIDLAVLDVNLGSQRSFPIADVLYERGIPFLFATGYGRKGLGGFHEHSVVLQKPFQLKDLRAAISSTFARFQDRRTEETQPV